MWARRMDRRMLFTYSNLEELRKYERDIESVQKSLHSFIIAENDGFLDDAEDIIIDITTIVQYLGTGAGNRLSVEVSLHRLDTDCIVIVEEKFADIAIKMFPHFFDKAVSLFDPEPKQVQYEKFERMTVYTYSNEKQLNDIIRYATEREIPLASFPLANGELRPCFDEFNKRSELSLIDLTSLSKAIDGNKSIIYLSEQFFGMFKNVKYIIMSSCVDALFEYFALCFEKSQPISHLIDSTAFDENVENMDENNKRCITDLSAIEFQQFCKCFDKNLIGHKEFKKRLFQSLKNFRTLNKVNDQKIFSIFLFGPSGIGKTETARLIAEQLDSTSHFPKINFANYSDQNALNILIGSPPGYVGCEHGELSDKVSKSKVGIILCDEFEKTNRPVFSFFLEMLEDGQFTDTMAREFDVNGFIVVFTSNIPNEQKYKEVIPPEFQTRLDLVCEFQEPNADEKLDFLNLLFSKAQEKYVEEFLIYSIVESDKKTIYDFDYQSIHALRDIKREFQNRLIQLFEQRQSQSK